MQHRRVDNRRPSTGYRLKSVLFTVTVTAAFVLGLYSLYLANANAEKMLPLATAGMIRTATAGDTEKTQVALGDLTGNDLIYVVLEAPEISPDPNVGIAVRQATSALADSGLTASVRFLDPSHSDFQRIVDQNGVSRFPAILAVKKDAGIVLVIDDINEENLLFTYYGVLGKTSSCNEAKSAVY